MLKCFQNTAGLELLTTRLSSQNYNTLAMDYISKNKNFLSLCKILSGPLLKGETRNLRNEHMRYGNERFLIKMEFIDSRWLLTCLPNFLTNFFSRHPTGLGRPGWNAPKWPILANFWDILKIFFLTEAILSYKFFFQK